MEKLIGLKKRQAKATGYSKHTKDPDEIEGLLLEEGEEICSSCKGRGYHPAKQAWNTMASTCQKCNGEGKVDWITNAMGVPKRKQQIYGTSSYSYCGTSGVGNISSSCISVVPGSKYVDTNTNKLQVFDGSKWQEVI
jgi:DnaJ-class molecular chaperone